MSHERRPDVQPGDVLHVSMRLDGGRRGLRRPRARDAILECFRAGKERFGFRLLHFSIQDTHLHLVCEAQDREAVTRGVQGLKIRIAKRLNKLWGRRGKVWRDRYHLSLARTDRAVRDLLRYVLENFRKHNNQCVANELNAVDWEDPTAPDPCASARYLEGFEVRGLDVRRHRPPADATRWPIARPVHSLLAQGFVRYYPLRLGAYESRAVLARYGLLA